MRRRFVLPLVLFAGVTASGAQTPGAFSLSADELRVRATVLDYAEGIYAREAGRLSRSLHPDVRRHIQVAREGSPTAATLDYDDLVTLASRDCDRSIPRRGPKRVVLYRLSNNVASARLTAAWGVDIIHLTKEDGRWRIVDIVGSALPASRESTRRG